MKTVGREALQTVFSPLPWGVCPFADVKDKLLDVRSISRIPENAQSVLVVLFPYLLEEEQYENTLLSRFAVPADYHLLCGEILQAMCADLKEAYPANTFAAFADISPLPEVYAAAKAGVGVIGKNGLLINENYGSWVFIGEIITDLPVASAQQDIKTCIGCDACMRACPTGALTEHGVQIDRCLSYISQKKKITDEEEQLLKQYPTLWGCDRCQKMCPQNRPAQTTPLANFRESAQNKQNRVWEWRIAAFERNTEMLKMNDE